MGWRLSGPERLSCGRYYRDVMADCKLTEGLSRSSCIACDGEVLCKRTEIPGYFTIRSEIPKVLRDAFSLEENLPCLKTNGGI